MNSSMILWSIFAFCLNVSCASFGISESTKEAALRGIDFVCESIRLGLETVRSDPINGLQLIAKTEKAFFQYAHEFTPEELRAETIMAEERSSAALEAFEELKIAVNNASISFDDLFFLLLKDNERAWRYQAALEVVNKLMQRLHFIVAHLERDFDYVAEKVTDPGFMADLSSIGVPAFDLSRLKNMERSNAISHLNTVLSSVWESLAAFRVQISEEQFSLAEIQPILMFADPFRVSLSDRTYRTPEFSRAFEWASMPGKFPPRGRTLLAQTCQEVIDELLRIESEFAELPDERLIEYFESTKRGELINFPDTEAFRKFSSVLYLQLNAVKAKYLKSNVQTAVVRYLNSCFAILNAFNEEEICNRHTIGSLLKLKQALFREEEPGNIASFIEF